MNKKPDQIKKTTAEKRKTKFVKIPISIIDEELEASLPGLLSLAEALNDGVVFITPNRKVLFANSVAMKILGVKKPADIINKQWEHCFMENDRGRCITHYDKDLTAKMSGNILMKINAVPFPRVLELSSSVLGKSGKILAYRTVIRDIRIDIKNQLKNFQNASLATLVNNVPGIVYYCMYDKDFTPFYINDYVRKVTGYPFTDFLDNSKRKFTDLMHQGDLTGNLKVISKALEQDKPYDIEYRVLHKNGTYRWLHERGRGIKDSNGNISILTGVSLDITDKKLIESKIAQNEQRLNAVFENAALAVMVLDFNGGIVQNNTTVEKMLGYCKNELIGKNYNIISHPDDLKVSREAVMAIVSGEKKTVSYEKRFLKKDGNVIWIRVTLSAISNPDGKSTHLIAFGENITQKHKIRERLEESEERYRTLVNNIPGVVFNSSTEPDWEMYYISKQIKALSGYDADDFLKGKKRLFGSIIHPVDRAKLVNDHQGNKIKKEPYAIEYRIIHKDKSIRWVHETGQAYFDRTLNKYCLTGVFVDISPRIIAEENQRLLMQNLQRAYKEVNEFAHIVSHDLKAPLRGISSLSTWLYEDYFDKLDEDGRKNLVLLQDRVEKMDALIDGILAYSSVSKGSKQIEEVDLNKVLESVGEMLEIPEGFKIIIKKQLPKVMANNYHMYQLFQNLVSNAIKYNGKTDGRVWIDYSSLDDKWVFTVKDKGIGIAKEYQHKIYDIFQTLNTSDRKSSGVGLSIVKKIVELYQGEIEIDSAPGKGTTFKFSILKDPESANQILDERK